MGYWNTEAILTITVQCVLVALLLLFLFRLRKSMGLGLLYITLGAFQFLQVFFASILFVEIAPGMLVSPGSVVLFSSTLFAILSVYIWEDALEARKIIYGLLAANIIMNIILFTVGQNLDDSYLVNNYALSKSLLYNNATSQLLGTALLFIDGILLILVYEYVSQKLKWIFLRILVTSVAVLIFDTLVFTYIRFLGNFELENIVYAGVIGKVYVAFLYTCLFYTYFILFERDWNLLKNYGYKDIFSILTYRQKFEALKVQNQKQVVESARAIRQSEIRYEAIFENSPVCLWQIEIDFIDKELTRLKKEGIKDIIAYLEQHPETFAQFLSSVLILNINKSGLDLFDAKNKDELKRNLPSTFTTEALAVFKKQLVDLYNDVEYSQTETEVKTLNGQFRRVILSANILRNQRGDHTDVMLAMQDITELKEFEHALRASEYRHRSIVENAEICIHELDLEGRFLSLNPVGLKMIGARNESEVIGKNYSDFVSLKDRERIKTLFEKTIATGVSSKFEFVANDDQTYFSSNFIPLKKNNTVNKVIGMTDDITELMMTHQELIESKEFLQNAIDSAMDGIVVVNDMGQIHDINPAFIHMTGFEKAELDQCPIPHPFWPKEEINAIIEKFKQVNLEESWEGEIKLCRKNGESFPCLVSLSPVQGYDGKLAHYMAIIKDISDNKKKELALLESEMRFRTIFEQAAVGMALSDTSTGRFLRVNRKYSEIVGYTREELLSMDFMSLTHPEDLKIDLDQMHMLREGAINSFTIEKRFITKTQKTVWVNLTVSPMQYGENFDQHIAVIEDITQFKLLRTYKSFNAQMLEKTAVGNPLIEIIQDTVIALEELIPGSHCLIELDPYGERRRTYGAKIPNQWKAYINHYLDHLWKSEDGGPIRHMVKTGKELWNNFSEISEMPEIQLDVLINSIWSEPIFSFDNQNNLLGSFHLYFNSERIPGNYERSILDEVGHMLSIIVDKTIAKEQLLRHQNHLEELVSQRTFELEKAKHEIESFSYSVSHDLKAPLMRIEGFGQALVETHCKNLDEKARHYLDRILSSTSMMKQRIDDMLMLSRLTQGNFNKEEIDLTKMALAIIEWHRKNNPQKDAQVIIEPDLRVTMDGGLAQLLMENLISNAWKFTRPRKVAKIHIGAFNKKGRKWYFVRDNGIGFDPCENGDIFRPFYRLHRDDEYEGTGIGLATVKRIIDKHGGKIIAKGREGEGAEFLFRI